MRLLGIDDAGRGPIIGPMYLAGVLIEDTDENILKDCGAKDSKLLQQSERVRLAVEIQKIARGVHVVESTPREIDRAVETTNLNTLEAKKAAEIINTLNDEKTPIKVIVDCPSTNLVAWKKTLLTFITYTKNLDIHCEHKADFNHAVVGAASIVAKVEREKAVERIKEQYGAIGSGYPSDPYTQEFIKKHKDMLKTTSIVRKSWSTWKTLVGEPVAKKKTTQKKLF